METVEVELSQVRMKQQLVQGLRSEISTRQLTTFLLEKCGLKTLIEQEEFLKSVIPNSRDSINGFNTWMYDSRRLVWVYPTEV